MVKKIPEQDEQKIADLALTGNTMLQIIKETKRCYSTIRGVLKRLNIKPRKDKRVWTELTDEQIQEILYLFDKGSSKNFLTMKFHISPHRLHNLLLEHELIKPEAEPKTEYKEINGEKVCTGMSYASYCKKIYSKNWEEKVRISKGNINFDDLNKRMDKILSRDLNKS